MTRIPRVPGHREATKDRPDAQQIHTMLLRSMQQAIYTRHQQPATSGLAYRAYTTSPARSAATLTCWCTA